MKKTISLLVVTALILSVFTSCGLSNKGTDNSIDANANKITAYDVDTADYQLNIDASNEVKDISELLYGIFFEDINFAADGGLYAEKVANRSFEFTDLAADDEMYAWSSVGEISSEVKINETDGCLNENNTNYLVLNNASGTLAGVQNKGFLEGMAIAEESYDFSVYAKALNGYTGGITVRLVAGKKTVDEKRIDSITDEWEKYELELTSDVNESENVYLQVLIDNGEAAVDMVSLFPEHTYKDRENGLRNDIATMLEELQPKFLRFPGGCVIEGYDEDTAYDWKASVGADEDGNPLEFNGKYGDVAARRQGIDVWTDVNATDDEYPSFMTYGLGFFEFFQLSEDIGAVGVPVLNAGMYCQGRNGVALEIGSDEFNRYVQDMLDLVEFCRGDENTTWGKVRVSLGHEEPFELKYICIGNENWGEDYYERYNEFVKALNEAKAENPELYKDIELIYSAGADDVMGSEDYLKAYEYASDKLSDNENNFAGAIDQHYYNGVDWFLKNTDYYDEENYSRTVDGMTQNYGGKINVFLGEYASWSNKMSSALAECAYMTGLERNGDIVAMSTYAPLLSSVTARHWAPDLIWFDNSSAMGSVNYYTQMLFSRNQGSKLLDSQLEGALFGNKELGGKVGVGTWNTQASFDNIKVVDNKTGEILAEDDFSTNTIKNWEKDREGKFKIKDGTLNQISTDSQTTDFGSLLLIGDSSWTDYTYTLEATKIDGSEGFFIPFSVNDNGMYFWNIGGYENTLSCLQEYSCFCKSGQLEGTVKDFVAQTGRTYQLKIVVSGSNIKCYIDDELYVDYNASETTAAQAYQVVSTDETGDIIIKLVNITGENKQFAVNIDNAKDIGSEAVMYQVAAGDYEFENIFGDENQVEMEEYKLSGVSSQFNFTAPCYSATVIRIPSQSVGE